MLVLVGRSYAPDRVCYSAGCECNDSSGVILGVSNLRANVNGIIATSHKNRCRDEHWPNSEGLTHRNYTQQVMLSNCALVAHTIARWSRHEPGKVLDPLLGFCLSIGSLTGVTAMEAKTRVQSEISAVSESFLAFVASVAAKDDSVTDTEIRELAYKLYEEHGRVDGSDLQDWVEAETILRERGKLEA